MEENNEGYYGHIVRVRCSPFAMANWALQYSDKVEILKPDELRENIKDKIKELNGKYDMSFEGSV